MAERPAAPDYPGKQMEIAEVRSKRIEELSMVAMTA